MAAVSPEEVKITIILVKMQQACIYRINPNYTRQQIEMETLSQVKQTNDSVYTGWAS